MSKKFTERFIAATVAMITMLTMATPAFALAHGNSKDKNDDNNRSFRAEQRTEDTNEFGVHVYDNNGKHFANLGSLSGMFYVGTVASVTGSGFTFTTKDNTTLTATTSGAKLIRLPRTEIVLADILVGDKVFITGTKSGSTVTASVVYDMSKNLKPAKAKGTVTAVNGNTVTVQTKDNKTATVIVDQDTVVKTGDHQTGTTADITVGSKVKVTGLWNTILNVLNAIKVKIM